MSTMNRNEMQDSLTWLLDARDNIVFLQQLFRLAREGHLALMEEADHCSDIIFGYIEYIAYFILDIPLMLAEHKVPQRIIRLRIHVHRQAKDAEAR